MFVPKLFTTLRGYDRRQFLADCTAGLIVGVVALPLCIAFAIASGLTPDRGLWTGVVAGTLISLLGGSRVQIGGPTGAFVVIVYGIVQRYGVDGLTVATLMAGGILVAMGFARLGALMKYVPYPVVTGFTAGIAVTIAAGEVRNALGLHIAKLPADFLERMALYTHHAGEISLAAVALCALTLAILLLWPKVTSRVPAPFVALIVTTVLVRLLHLPVETIGDRFGQLAATLPHPTLPSLTLAQVRELVAPAFTIAALGAIESLLSAVVADGMVGGRHRSDMELVAQGVANLASPLFGGMPATGAIARTATNVKAGGRTPVAGIVHALTLLVITLFAGRWAALIPFATLAGILLMVCWHMGEWKVFAREFRGPRSDVVVMVTTFLLTVLVDLTVAVGVGLTLAAVLFIKRMAEVTDVSAVTDEIEGPAPVTGAAAAEANAGAIYRRRVPAGMEVYEINGPFFFGAAALFRDTLGQVARRPRILVVRMRNVPVIDATGLHALTELVRRCHSEGTRVVLSEVRAQPLAVIGRSGLRDELGEENLVDSIDAALALSAEAVGGDGGPSAHADGAGARRAGMAERV